MEGRNLFAAIGALAILCGALFWWVARPVDPQAIPDITPGALFGAQLSDARGAEHSLGELQGQVIVLNFWATWCAPCREEMPAFERLQQRFRSKGVRFVGLSDEPAALVDAFAKRWMIGYDLWTGADAVQELGRRLGNRTGVLPYTVVFDRRMQPVATKVGAYSERELESLLQEVVATR